MKKLYVLQTEKNIKFIVPCIDFYTEYKNLRKQEIFFYSNLIYYE